MALELHNKLQVLLKAALNPPDLESGSQRVFHEANDAEDILRKFHISSRTYQTVWPKHLPTELKTTTGNNDASYHTELKVFIAAPSSLRNASKRTLIRPAVRFHGGGGTTGKPLFPPWISKADYTYMLEAENMISIEPEYCLMPESSGLDILQNVKAFCKWLFRDLPEAVRSINPFLEVDWNCLSIFGESFGGLIAMILYLIIGCCSSKPLNLRISGMVLRCPLSEPYKRKEGFYCGEFRSKERAKRTCLEVDEIIKKMPWVKRRKSTAPPDGMWCAYSFSVCDEYWEGCWKTSSLPEMIRDAGECPDLRTIVRITHGKGDVHVPWESSYRLVEVLRKKWPGLRVKLDLVDGKEHAWDHSEPLKPDYERFLQNL